MGEITFVKYCPLCGMENPRQQAFCLSCLDGDLTTVPAEPRREASAPVQAPPPTVAPAGEAATALYLELVDNPAIRFRVQANQSVGRNEKADVILADVPKVEWISGAHARFLRRGAQWYVQHIGRTNFITVDGETFAGQEEVPVRQDSVIVLSLTAFRVTFEDV